MVFAIYWHESAMDIHVFPIPIPLPTFFSTWSLWVFPLHQPQALVSCLHPGLAIWFTLDNIQVSVLFSQIIPPSPSPTESKSLFCTSVSLFLFCIWVYRYFFVGSLLSLYSYFVAVMSSLELMHTPLTSPGEPPGLAGGSDGKESACNVGNLGSTPGLRRSPGEGNGYPLQYSGLENSMDYIVHGVAKSWTWLRDFHFPLTFYILLSSDIKHFTDSLRTLQ